MVNLSKYPTNGIARFEDFFEQLLHVFVHSVFVNSDYASDNEWELGINIELTDDFETHLEPFIGYLNEWGNANCQLSYYLGIKNSDKRVETKVMLVPGGEAQGPTFKFFDLPPELLEDGDLIIEYGFRVEAIQKDDGIWNFPLYTEFFGSNGDDLMILLWETNRIRCHKQVNDLHLIKSNDTDFYFGPHSNFYVLQIAHGVHAHYSPSEYEEIALDACILKLRNVAHHCQWKLIQMKNEDFRNIRNQFVIALDCDMRSYLAHLMREMNSKKDLMKMLRYMDIDEMSGEAMKTFLKFLVFE